MRRVDILGVGFDNLTLLEATALVSGMLDGDSKNIIVTPNPEIVQMCANDPDLRFAVNNAQLVVPDGIGVIYAAKIMDRPLKQKVPGIELAQALLPIIEKKGKRLYLLGAAPGIAEIAASRLKSKYPSLNIAGTHDGYFKDEEQIIKEINQSSADVVFVCLGAPKQELFMMRNIGRINAKVMMGLGGSLDVFSGNIKRAPMIFRRLGLEWLYRLLKEPRRIKRMIKLPIFLLSAVSFRLGKNR